MTSILHIVTRANDQIAAEVAREQERRNDVQVRTADLTRGAVDYQKLLRDIFEADSIHVW